MAKKTVNVYEAKTKFSWLVREVADGEEIVIAKAGKPVARLVPYAPVRKARRPGGSVGRIQIAKDFDAPLPPEVLAGFLGHA